MNARALIAFGVGVTTASCATDTVTPSERAAAECAEIIDGEWVGELDGDTLSARVSYVGSIGCLREGDGRLNTVEADWSWREFRGNDHNSSGRFIYRPDSSNPDSIWFNLFDNSAAAPCLNPALENRLEAYFAEPNRLKGTVTLWLGEFDSTGMCSDSSPALVDLRDTPVALIRAGQG